MGQPQAVLDDRSVLLAELIALTDVLPTPTPTEIVGNGARSHTAR